MDGENYVASFTATSEITAVQIQRSVRGRLIVRRSIGDLDAAVIHSWTGSVVPPNKAFDVAAPVGSVIEILSGSAVSSAYYMPYDDDSDEE